MTCPQCPHEPHTGWCQQCNCFYQETSGREYARSEDPPTSSEPYERHIKNWKSQSGRALLVHYENARVSSRGLNHYECNELALQRGWYLGDCYWHRIGDLAKWGYITELRDSTGEIVTRPGKFADRREVFVITEYGRRRARELMQ